MNLENHSFEDHNIVEKEIFFNNEMMESDLKEINTDMNEKSLSTNTGNSFLGNSGTEIDDSKERPRGNTNPSDKPETNVDFTEKQYRGSMNTNMELDFGPDESPKSEGEGHFYREEMPKDN